METRLHDQHFNTMLQQWMITVRARMLRPVDGEKLLAFHEAGKSFVRNDVPISHRASLWDCATPQSARTYAQQLKVAIKLVDRQHKKPAMELFFMFQKLPEMVREIERLARLPEGEEEAIDLLIWMKTWILHDRAKGTFAQWMDFDDFVDMERTPEPVQRDLDALLMALLAMQWQRRKHVWNVAEHKREIEHAMRDYTHIGGRNDEYCERSYKNVWGLLGRIQRYYE
ncbi:hypothetical protein LTS18_000264, partial [Coniosporium uncinatum]